ncbi:MAG: tetratricopeptide repeat protein [Myxococcales bacterium]|nr:tetratricopeptide repeat protein [Myxococcales bacterium]
MLPRVVLCSVLAAGLVTSPSVAFAKGAPSAKQAEKDGQKAEKQGKWEEAKAAYEKALELDDKAETRLRLATVEEKLGHLVEAADHLKKALEAKKISGAQSAKAKRDLKALEKRIPTLTFDLPKGFGGTVKLDDRQLSAGELGGPVPANPGRHEVKAEAEGMKPYAETVELAEKDKKNLSVLMTELPKEEPTSSDEPEKDKPKATGGNKTLAYVALGVGVVGLGVGAFMGLQAKQTKGEIDDKCKNGVCPEGERDLYDKGKSQADISTVGFIVGAVGIGAGTVLLLTGGKGGKVESKTEARRFVPYVGPAHAGVYGQF